MKMGNMIKVVLCLSSTLFMANAFADNQELSKNPNTNANQSLLMPSTSSQSSTQTSNKATAATTTTTVQKEGHATKKERSKNYFSDAEITTKVKEQFFKEKLFDKKNIPAMRIHVKTVNGVVYLKGKVKSKEQEDSAISMAKSISGVKEVKSNLKIKQNNKKEKTKN